jgi:alpha-tubulin suppressor-like RCC1 family protein
VVVGDLPAEAKGEDGSYCYEVCDLMPDSVYYCMVTASNEMGEGYRPKHGKMIKTMSESIYQGTSLYVWGNNESSELALSEEIIDGNKEFCEKTKVIKPFKNAMFDGIVYQMAAGNVSTVYNCVSENLDTFIVFSGTALELIEGKKECESNYLTNENLVNYQRIGSIPYKISFDVPVSQVICGDLFAGLVTSQGGLYTWGANDYGQLGIDNQRVLQVK